MHSIFPLRLNFVYTADTIGGNSGSPVINRNAEIVGHKFRQQHPKTCRTDTGTSKKTKAGRAVGVHSAGILEALRKVYETDARLRRRSRDSKDGPSPYT